jgi:tRNA A-37 threonylcarbamoyl transferase component Bud32
MRWGVVVLFVTCALLVGCSGGETYALRTWDVSIEGGPPQSVDLPARLPAPEHAVRFTLRTEAHLPPAMVGLPVSLTILDMPALASVSIGGEAALPCSPAPWETYRTLVPHCWHLPALRSADIRIEITGEDTFLQAARVNTVPTLSATPAGDARYAFVRAFDLWTAAACAFCLLVTGGLYFIVYLYDRKQVNHAWFASAAAGALIVPLYTLGITQPILGLHEPPVFAVFSGWSAFSGVHFSRRLLGLRPPGRVWLLPFVAIGVWMFAWDPPYHSWFHDVPLLAWLAAAMWHNVIVGVLAMRDPARRTEGVVISLALLIGTIAGLPDAYYVLGFQVPAEGLKGGSLGLLVIALGQSALLARDHALSLKRTDALNLALGDRVRRLEQRDEENRALNDELRRQVAARSQQLAEALQESTELEAPARFTVGDVLKDRYRIVRQLGEGGMGVVYEVLRISDGRRLALKTLSAGVDRGARARLAREAQIAAQVAHPNLVTVYDIDVTPSGWLFLILELVEGTSLADPAYKFPETSWALDVLRQVAEGLAALHSRGIVHRDLKPANVLIGADPEGRVRAKITDFGIASLRDTTASDRPGDVLADTMSAPTPSAETLTRTGTLLGTPLYMAPELARGSKLATAAADVFAFGVLAHSVLTGRYPFHTAPLLDAIHGRKSEVPVRLTARAPSVAAGLATVIDACLSVDAASRPTASALAGALSRGTVEGAA